MENTKIAIISEAMILRRGLRAFLLNNLDSSLIIEEFRTPEDFRESYSFNQFSVVFLQHSSLKEFSGDEKLLKQVSDLYLITIYEQDTPPENVPYVTDSLYCRVTDEEMAEKLNLWKNEWLDEVMANSEERDLSDREKNVLKLVAKGMTNKEVAEVLFLSPHTVITHRKNITKKLGIQTVSGLTVYALINNLIEPSDVNK